MGGQGRCTMVWLYGFKLHIVINDCGEIIQWPFTLENMDDRVPRKTRI
ncbi:transposase [uncultured Prevotella sp.]|nr:transposase [uncultured Prevotella sp.]